MMLYGYFFCYKLSEGMIKVNKMVFNEVILIE